MRLVWLSLFAASAWIVHVDTLLISPSAPYGPLCWGPGIWPHPEHCRLFTICQLKHQVKGQLYACPENTGFSTKHLRCIAEDKVPGCRMSAPFSEKKLSESTAVRFSEESEKPDRNLCYKNKTSTPFCLDEATLVVCGPREAFVGTVDCSKQNQVGQGICDRDIKSCAVEKVLPQDDVEPQVTSPTISVSSTDASTAVPEEQGPLSTEQLHNITAALLEEIAASNITLFPSESTPTPAVPTLPSTSEVSCARPGLQCYDNVTIIDCPDDESEPNFIMSCSNIIQTTENATGYCNSENPSCALLIENFLLNMDISNFNLDDSNHNAEMGFADMDEDYEGPELYDSDNLRESPDDFFDGLSWFRHEPKSSPSDSLPDTYSTNGNKYGKRRGKELFKGKTENDKELIHSFGKFESHKIPISAFPKDEPVERSSEKFASRASRSLRSTTATLQKIKRAGTIDANAGARDVLERFLAKCQQGGLFCFDNTTLVACSGDGDTPTYAVECYGEAVSASGRRLQAFCDQALNSCVVNIDDAPDAYDAESFSRNVEVLNTTTSAERTVSH